MTKPVQCFFCKRPVTVQVSEYEDVCDACVGRFERGQQAIKAREGRCDICRRVATLVVDHDHRCHKTSPCHKCKRGRLCINCNTGLGKLGDTVEGLRRALAYLEAYEARARGV